MFSCCVDSFYPISERSNVPGKYRRDYEEVHCAASSKDTDACQTPDFISVKAEGVPRCRLITLLYCASLPEPKYCVVYVTRCALVQTLPTN